MLRSLNLALILLILIAASDEVGAQATEPTAPSTTSAKTNAATPSSDALTLKERLGAKWKDEQRVDNCKVPPEKRGTKPRPDSCAHPKSQ
jgi:hypothetical protein